MKKYSILNVLLGLLLSIFIITLSVVITLNFKGLYYFDVGYLNIPTKSGYSKEVIINNYDILIDYNSPFYSGELSFPDFNMSKEGKIHFEEVKSIFNKVWVLFVSSFLLLVFLCVNKTKKKDFSFLKLGSIFSVLIPAVCAFLISLNWDSAFTLFHEIFFNNDYWIFDYRTDPIIEILPEEFFLHCALLIIFITLLLSLGLYLTYKKLSKEEKI